MLISHSGIEPNKKHLLGKWKRDSVILHSKNKLLRLQVTLCEAPDLALKWQGRISVNRRKRNMKLSWQSVSKELKPLC